MQRYNKNTNSFKGIDTKKGLRCKYLLVLLLVLLFQCPYYSYSQKVIAPVKVESKKDTTKLEVDSSIYNNAIQDPIFGKAVDSIVYMFGDVDTLVLFYNEANIKSMDMELDAANIVMSKKNNTLFGTGVPDTAGVLQGTPVFKSDGAEYNTDTITYNYTSKKARIINVYTKQGDGFLYGDVSKRMDDNSTFIKGAKYTTCDHPEPHFYIRMTKGKIVDKPNKYIYFGPSYLVIEDVPFPLILPFGFFPQLSSRSSGIRVPSYGEEVSRGFFLRNFGYYMAIGDYMDLDLLADYYTMGSWAVRSNANYTKRYKFDGKFNLEYANNVTGEKGSPDHLKATSFSVRWSHSQSPKAKPGTSFSANVNFSSINNKDYLNGRHNPLDNVQNSINSSISYGKSWTGKPYNFSVNASHSQNMRDSTYSITFPNFTFSLSRIKPFERKERIGKKAFYEDISFTYSATFDNKVNFKESEVSQVAKKITNGLNHNINIGLPNFSLLKYINVAPSVQYGTKWFFKKTEQSWDENNKIVVKDTTKIFGHFGATHEYGFGISASTQIYGMLNFKKGSLIEAVRHVLKPSISMNYGPNLRKKFNGWRTVQVNDLGATKEYNIYEGQVYSAPSQTENGSMGFSLGNNLEMKVRDRKDTTGISKMAILNTFDISTSYNFLKDSMKLSDIQFRGSTNMPGQTAVSFNFTVSPYDINYKGQVYNKIKLLGRLTSFGFSFGRSFSGGGASSGGLNNLTGIANTDNTNKEKADEDEEHKPEDKTVDKDAYNPLKYEKFTMPWTFSFNFNYNYNKSYTYYENSQTLIAQKNHMPTLNFSGSISPTENWDIRVSSGFDLKQRKLTTTQISIARKLHCFDFSLNWTPLGRFQSWDFRIAISSSMLADLLKYDKQSSYMDNRY